MDGLPPGPGGSRGSIRSEAIAKYVRVRAKALDF